MVRLSRRRSPQQWAPTLLMPPTLPSVAAVRRRPLPPWNPALMLLRTSRNDMATTKQAPAVPERTPENTPLPGGGKWIWDEQAADWRSLDDQPADALKE
jgi:hypothetical protein